VFLSNIPVHDNISLRPYDPHYPISSSYAKAKKMKLVTGTNGCIAGQLKELLLILFLILIITARHCQDWQGQVKQDN